MQTGSYSDRSLELHTDQASADLQPCIERQGEQCDHGWCYPSLGSGGRTRAGLAWFAWGLALHRLNDALRCNRLNRRQHMGSKTSLDACLLYGERPMLLRGFASCKDVPPSVHMPSGALEHLAKRLWHAPL